MKEALAGLQHARLEFGRQSCVVRQHQVAHMAGRVVGPLGAVNERAALQRHASAVGAHVFVGRDTAHGHRQSKLDHVAPFPVAAQARITFLELDGNELAIDLERGRLLDPIQEAVEVAGRRFITRPARNAHVDRKPGALVRVDRQLDGAVLGPHDIRRFSIAVNSSFIPWRWPMYVIAEKYSSPSDRMSSPCQ